MNLKKNIWQSIAAKPGIKLISFALAIVAWLFVNSGQIVEQHRSLRLEYVQIPKGLVFQTSPIKEVKIDLVGSLYRLRTIRAQDLTYVVDLSDAKAGLFRTDIDIDRLRLPVDIEARHLEPRTFSIHLEEMLARSVPIKPVLSGAPKPGFAVSRITSSPEQATISGPRSVISKIDSVSIPINLQNRDANFDFSLKPDLNLPDSEVLEPLAIRVEIHAQKMTREWDRVPVVLVGATSASKLSPQVARVVVEGAEAETLKLDPRLRVEIPARGLKRGRYRMRGTVQLPAGVKLISLEPSTFLVEIEP